MVKNKIATGAEAIIYEDKIFGMPVIIKKRTIKEYRNKTLDSKIRKARNKEEAILLKKITAIKLNAPHMFYIGHDKIIMEKLADTKTHALCLKEIGNNIAQMHNHSIIHGDLNLINIITSSGNKIYFIDFGLGFMSNKVEDKATDLLVFKKTLLSRKETEEYWKDILEGYTKSTNNKSIIGQIGIIEKRGRYL